MDISKFSKAKVLAALFNAARPVGLGWLHYDPSHTMDETEASELLLKYQNFDYVEGRVMKISLDSDELDTSLYNRDNGENAAENAIEAIEKSFEKI